MYRRIAYYLAAAALLLGIAAGVAAGHGAIAGHNTGSLSYLLPLEWAVTTTMHEGGALLAAEAGVSDKFAHVHGGGSAEPDDVGPVESISLN